MRKALKKLERGFTLIELMIVVAIVGVLAVLAIYGVRKYIANSKTAEARNSLGQIGKDAATAFEKESMAGTVLSQGASTAVSRALCLTAAPVPSTIAGVQGKKYQSSPTNWSSDVGWSCLKYTMDQPQYFMYTYTQTGNSAAVGGSFTAMANGDLNGDGIASTFTLGGSIQTGNVINVAPNLIEVNPEE